MSKFKKGDKVRALKSSLDIVEGCDYRVTSVDGPYVGVIDDSGEPNFLLHNIYYEDANPVIAFIINGANYEYPTLEAAEAGVKAIGNNGVTYEIAQIVKRVTVKRETVVTLEDTV
jgi:hypothetical protein